MRKTNLVLFIVILVFGLMIGCAGKTITQQMATQTSDPAMMALATYADALQAYVDAQEIYLPYQQIIKQTDPALNDQIIGYFKQARKILNGWKIAGSIGQTDKTKLQQTLREISLALAKQIDERKVK